MSKLLLSIKSRYSKMSKSEQRIADYIFKNSGKVSTTGINEFSATCGVSEATVVRFSKRIGCSGYAQLKILLAQEKDNHHIVNESIANDDSFLSMYGKIADDVYSSIIKTKNCLTDEILANAYSLMDKAKEIVIDGVGNSYAMGLDLYHKLLRLGLNVHIALDSHFSLILASRATKNTLWVAITHSGVTRDIIDSVMIAKEKGAKVLSITSDMKSPVAQASDCAIQTCSDEVNYRILGLSSRYASLIIFDTLYSYFVLHKKQSEEMIEDIEQRIAIKRVKKKGR